MWTVNQFRLQKKRKKETNKHYPNRLPSVPFLSLFWRMNKVVSRSTDELKLLNQLQTLFQFNMYEHVCTATNHYTNTEWISPRRKFRRKFDLYINTHLNEQTNERTNNNIEKKTLIFVYDFCANLYILEWVINKCFWYQVNFQIYWREINITKKSVSKIFCFFLLKKTMETFNQQF